MMSNSRQVLFLILDAAEASLLRRWATGGHLPVLSTFLDNSLSGPVATVPGVFSVGTWFSLATGMTPPHHRRCSWLRFDPQSYTLDRPDPGDMPYSSFWQMLDQVGCRVGVIDYPRLPLLKMERGVQVVDWYPHDVVYDATRTSPESFSKTHLARHPADPCEGNCDRWGGGAQALTQAMLSRIDAKCDLVTTLLGDQSWDQFTVSFGEAHCIGHRCWHLQSVASESTPHDSPLSQHDPVVCVYRALDSAIGRILDVVDADTTVVLLANPGMEASWHAYGIARRALRALNAGMPHGIESRAEADSGLDEAALRRATERSFEYPIGNGHFAIRLNLVGREKHGRIHPGVEAEAYLRELSVEMMALPGPDGEPLFDEIVQTSRCYHTGMDHALPDLLFRWSRRQRRNTGGVPNGDPDRLPPGRSGDHRAGGMYAVRDRNLHVGNGPGVRDLDIGITLAAMSGVAMPSRDGQVIDAWRVMG